jgi:hypothetical protein
MPILIALAAFALGALITHGLMAAGIMLWLLALTSPWSIVALAGFGATVMILQVVFERRE